MNLTSLLALCEMEAAPDLSPKLKDDQGMSVTKRLMCSQRYYQQRDLAWCFIAGRQIKIPRSLTAHKNLRAVQQMGIATACRLCKRPAPNIRACSQSIRQILHRNGSGLRSFMIPCGTSGDIGYFIWNLPGCVQPPIPVHEYPHYYNHPNDITPFLLSVIGV